jgi:hypothetical protein
MSPWRLPGFRTDDTALAACMNKLSCSGKSPVMLRTYHSFNNPVAIRQYRAIRFPRGVRTTLRAGTERSFRPRPPRSIENERT